MFLNGDWSVMTKICAVLRVSNTHDDRTRQVVNCMQPPSLARFAQPPMPS